MDINNVKFRRQIIEIGNLKYNIIKKFHPILEIECNYHTGQREPNGKLEVSGKLKVQRFIDVLNYKCGDVNEENYELINDDYDIMMKLAKAEATRYTFTCICSKSECRINNMIRYKPTNEIFLVGAVCYGDTFPRLRDENIENRKSRKKLYTTYQKIENMTVNFGKYKGFTFNDIDEWYAINIIIIPKDFTKINNSEKIYNKVELFFSIKFNLEIK